MKLKFCACKFSCHDNGIVHINSIIIMYSLKALYKLYSVSAACFIKPLGMVGGHSRSLRDATGPVDMHSRIPTSTQVTCIAA